MMMKYAKYYFVNGIDLQINIQQTLDRVEK